MLKVSPIKTSIFHLGDNFEEFLLSNTRGVLKNGMILAITSKVVSLAEGRIESSLCTNKVDLICREADHYLGEIGFGCHLTIKHGLLIPSAGIDESNSENGDFILYPKSPYQSARKIHMYLKEKLGLKKMGIILTDSHTMPLRRGVLGVALAYHGFKGVRDMRGAEDLFDRRLKMTEMNIADGLAVAATLMMGEGAECCPLAIIEAAVEFCDSSKEKELSISLNEDLYRPLLERCL